MQVTTGTKRTPYAETGRRLLGALAVTCCAAASGHAVDRFDRIIPETAGYSSEKLQALPPFLAAAGSQSLLLLYDGKVFFEWGDIQSRSGMYHAPAAESDGMEAQPVRSLPRHGRCIG